MAGLSTVLVTGASGFLGGHVVRYLQALGYHVVPAGRAASRSTGVAFDVGDAQSVNAAFRRMPCPGAVVHCAALAHRERRSVAATAYERINHVGLRHVLEAARDKGVDRFVFISSAVVYGERPRAAPVAETEPREPLGPYAISKCRAEDACTTAVEQGYACVTLRFPAIYARHWLLNVRKRAYLPGSGNHLFVRVLGAEPRYSLCGIDTAVAAVELAIRPTTPLGIYNVCDARVYSQADVREAVAAVDGWRPTLPVHASWVRLPLAGAARFARAGVAADLWSSYWKLFTGMELDPGKIRRAGLDASDDLTTVLA